MAQLRTGDRAPAFSLRDRDGNSVRSGDFAGSKLAVYFYPKADTPGCTLQSCAVRDALPDLAAAGVAAVGISPDGPEAQKAFDEKYALGFPLLSDEDHAVAEAYGAWGEKTKEGRTYMGIIRSAFLLDETGRITEARYGIAPEDTVPMIRRALGLAD